MYIPEDALVIRQQRRIDELLNSHRIYSVRQLRLTVSASRTCVVDDADISECHQIAPAAAAAGNTRHRPRRQVRP